MRSFLIASVLVCMSAIMFFAGLSNAAEIRVMSSGGFYAALVDLAPQFERATGHKVILISGSSMGSSPTSIPARLERGEAADVLILAGSEVDKLIKQKKVVEGSRVDLVLSKIGMVVRAGTPKPDISTPEALKRTLLNAKSIGYSASASGVYLSTVMFKKMGIYDQVMPKAKEIVGDRVATWVARGDLEIGFQQVSELLPVSGVDFVGTLPEPLQKVTVFSSGIAVKAGEPEAGKALVKFLLSPAAYPVIEKQGLEPASPQKPEQKK
jgi:molybdate transport system substrate-binding protein